MTILSRSFPPAPSGIADHTDLLAHALGEHDLDVRVVTGRGSAPRPFPVTSLDDDWRPARILAALAESKPDVILWQYNPFEVGPRGLGHPAAALARAMAGLAPLAVLFHEIWFPWGRNGLRGTVWAASQRMQSRGVVRAASACVVTTERREAELRPTRPRILRRIPIGSNVIPGERSAREDLAIPTEAFVLVHLGSVGPGRDLGPALDALRDLRSDGSDVRLLLTGRTGPFTPPSDLSDAIIVSGEADDLSPTLRAGDAYFHVDHAGPAAGRRGSLVAALDHGLPVIAFRGPDQASELVDGQNIVLVDPTPASIAAAVRDLRSDPARARDIGDAAHETYVRSFSWAKVGHDMASLLVEISR